MAGPEAAWLQTGSGLVPRTHRDTLVGTHLASGWLCLKPRSVPQRSGLAKAALKSGVVGPGLSSAFAWSWGRSVGLRGALGSSGVARPFDAPGRAPDVTGVCEWGLLGVAFCFRGAGPTGTLWGGGGGSVQIVTPAPCCSHSFSSLPQTCFSSSTTKTATSRACSTRPTLGAEQGAQSLPVHMPAPQAACPHLLPR